MGKTYKDGVIKFGWDGNRFAHSRRVRALTIEELIEEARRINQRAKQGKDKMIKRSDVEEK